MDALPMFERWHWTLENVDNMDFDDFCLLADSVDHLNKRDQEARAAQAKGKR
jgi:hypothetical protein